MQHTAMRTHTGQPIWFHRPEETEVKWADLDVSLCTQRRFLGYLDWSIAQHLALCIGLARIMGADDRLIALCASHDLHEAYTMDLVKGLKECLPGYAAIEQGWEKHVHVSLGLGWPLTADERRFVKRVDVRALGVEIQCSGWSEWSAGRAVLDGHPVTDAERLAFGTIKGFPAEFPMTLVRRVIATATKK